jgi:hypothetical protein
MPAPDEYSAYFQEQQGNEQNAYLSQIASNTGAPMPQLPSWDMINQRQMMIRSSAQMAATPPPSPITPTPQAAMNFIPGAASSAPMYSPVSVGIPQGASPFAGGDAFAGMYGVNAAARAHMMNASPMVASYAGMPGSGISGAFPSMGNFLAPNLGHFMPRNIVSPQAAFTQRSMWEDIQASTAMYIPRETYFGGAERERAAVSMLARKQGLGYSMGPGIGRALQYAGAGALLSGVAAPIGVGLTAVGTAIDWMTSGFKQTYQEGIEGGYRGALHGGQFIESRFGVTPNFESPAMKERAYLTGTPEYGDLYTKLVYGKRAVWCVGCWTKVYRCNIWPEK